jgi:hypothetical protein
MGSNGGSPGMGGKTADAGKQAMMEAMMRKQREEQVTNAQRSPVNADFRPGLEPDYSDMEANNRYSGPENRSNVEAANPTTGFNMPVKGGISMGPGRSSRYTDEEAQELMRRAQEQRR